MKAKKKFGQHFLKDASTAEQIANLTDNYNNIRNVLEVGPGTGALTQFLKHKDINLKAVEIDPDAIRYLLDNNILVSDQIIDSSFLDVELDQVFDGEEFMLIGNFPYNISSQILFRGLNYRHVIPVIIGMFQKEVAHRVVSSHGTKQYGVISVLMQLYYHGHSCMELPPAAFVPPPKVNSTVIAMQRRDMAFDGNYDEIRTLVKSAFGQRRKKLRNALHAYVNDKNKEWEIWDLRAEQLSVEDFILLYEKLFI